MYLYKLIWSTVCVLLVIPSPLLPAEHNLKGRHGEGYYVEVSLGTPSQKFNVLVDTGSTNFAIAGASNPNVDSFFVETDSSSYQPLHSVVTVHYTQGYWGGQLGSDVVYFPNLKVPRVRCDVSLIKTSNNFYMNGSDWQGILGLAYPVIAQPDHHTLSWLEALCRADPSLQPAFTLELCGPSPGSNNHTGILQVSGETKPMITSPIVRGWFYEVLLVRMNVGNVTVDLPCRELNNDKTIIDSGTTNLRLPVKVFAETIRLIGAAVAREGVVIDQNNCSESGMLCWNHLLTISIFPHLSLSLSHSDTSYFTLDLPPKSYLHSAETLGHPNCYKCAIESSDTGTVLGVVVMEGLIVSFNQTNNTVGFSESTCGPDVRLLGPFKTDSETNNCRYIPPMGSVTALAVAAYVTLALLSVCGMLLLYFMSQWLCDRYFKRKLYRNNSEDNLVTD